MPKQPLLAEGIRATGGRVSPLELAYLPGEVAKRLPQKKRWWDAVVQSPAFQQAGYNERERIAQSFVVEMEKRFGENWRDQVEAPDPTTFLKEGGLVRRAVEYHEELGEKGEVPWHQVPFYLGFRALDPALFRIPRYIGRVKLGMGRKKIPTPPGPRPSKEASSLLAQAYQEGKTPPEIFSMMQESPISFAPEEGPGWLSRKVFPESDRTWPIEPEGGLLRGVGHAAALGGWLYGGPGWVMKAGSALGKTKVGAGLAGAAAYGAPAALESYIEELSLGTPPKRAAGKALKEALLPALLGGTIGFIRGPVARKVAIQKAEATGTAIQQEGVAAQAPQAPPRPVQAPVKVPAPTPAKAGVAPTKRAMVGKLTTQLRTIQGQKALNDVMLQNGIYSAEVPGLPPNLYGSTFLYTAKASSIEIADDIARALGSPETGELLKAALPSSGVKGVILTRAGDITTKLHETGHILNKLLSTPGKPSFNVKWYAAAANELERFRASIGLAGTVGGLGPTELFPEWLASYYTNPALMARTTPKALAAYVSGVRASGLVGLLPHQVDDILRGGLNLAPPSLAPVEVLASTLDDVAKAATTSAQISTGIKRIQIPTLEFGRWAKEHGLGRASQEAIYKAADAGSIKGMLEAIPSTTTKYNSFVRFLTKHGINVPTGGTIPREEVSSLMRGLSDWGKAEGLSDDLVKGVRRWVAKGRLRDAVQALPPEKRVSFGRYMSEVFKPWRATYNPARPEPFLKGLAAKTKVPWSPRGEFKLDVQLPDGQVVQVQRSGAELVRYLQDSKAIPKRIFSAHVHDMGYLGQPLEGSVLQPRSRIVSEKDVDTFADQIFTRAAKSDVAKHQAAVAAAKARLGENYKSLFHLSSDMAGEADDVFIQHLRDSVFEWDRPGLAQGLKRFWLRIYHKFHTYGSDPLKGQPGRMGFVRFENTIYNMQQTVADMFGPNLKGSPLYKLGAKEMRHLWLNRMSNAKYPLPTHLKAAGQFVDDIFTVARDEMVKRGLPIGEFPKSLVTTLKGEIAHLKEQASFARPDIKVGMLDEIDDLERMVGVLRSGDVRFWPQIYIGRKGQERMVQTIRSFVGKRNVTLKMIMDSAERNKVIPIQRIDQLMGDYVARTMHACAVHDFLGRIANVPELAARTTVADPSWLKAPGNILAFRGKALHPWLHDLVEELTFSGKYAMPEPGGLLNLFKMIIFRTKQITFWNPARIAINNMGQGVWSGAADRPWHWPRAMRNAYRSITTKDRYYQDAIRNGVMSGRHIHPLQSTGRTVIDLMEARLPASQRRAAIELASAPNRLVRSLVKAKMLAKSALSLEWRAAWGIDEWQRMFNIHQLMLSGKTQAEAMHLTKLFLADYGAVPKQMARRLSWLFFVPTYRISMFKATGTMVKGAVTNPKLYAAPMVRWAAIKAGVYAAGAYYGWRHVNWYRLTKREGRVEKTWVAPGPLWELEKLMGSSITRTLQRNLNVPASIVAHVLQNRDYKGDPIYNINDSPADRQADMLFYLFKRVFPPYESFARVLGESDPELSSVQKLAPMFFVSTYNKRVNVPWSKQIEAARRISGATVNFRRKVSLRPWDVEKYRRELLERVDFWKKYSAGPANETWKAAFNKWVDLIMRGEQRQRDPIPILDSL